MSVAATAPCNVIATANRRKPGRTLTNVGAQITFDLLTEPGAYVCNWSGHLLRVPDPGAPCICGPPVNLIGQEPLVVTRISADPHIPLAAARRRAAEWGVRASF